MTEPTTPQVALVLVSHSTTLAEGLADLARQMAPDVLVLPAGGADDGSLGTSAGRIGAAVERATADGSGAVVLSDLGSAALTTDMVLELHDPAVAARVRQAHAPFVEGAVAAAVAAQGGADLATVHQAAVDAGRGFGPAGILGVAAADEEVATTDGAVTRTVVLPNPLGLHARPAAVLSRLVARFDAQVEIDGANAASVLELMRLAAPGGRELVVTGTGPEARSAVDAVVATVEGGFGEI